MGEKWNIERANQLLSAALAEVDELGDKLSPARAEALRTISAVHFCAETAVMAHCEEYARRFRALGEEED